MRDFLKKAGLVLLFMIILALWVFVIVSTGLTVMNGYIALEKLGYSPVLVFTMMTMVLLFALFLAAWAVWFIKKRRKKKDGR